MNPGRELIKASKPLGGSGPGQGLQTEHTVQPSPQFRGLSVPTHSFGGMPAAPSSPLLRGDMTLCASPEGMGCRSTGGPSLLPPQVRRRQDSGDCKAGRRVCSKGSPASCLCVSWAPCVQAAPGFLSPMGQRRGGGTPIGGLRLSGTPTPAWMASSLQGGE